MAKATFTTISGETRLMRTPIRDEGATARERRPATRQFTGSLLLALRIVPESELKMMITKLAATASWILPSAGEQ